MKESTTIQTKLKTSKGVMFELNSGHHHYQFNPCSASLISFRPSSFKKLNMVKNNITFRKTQNFDQLMKNDEIQTKFVKPATNDHSEVLAGNLSFFINKI